jgi:hypothetical protein
MKESKMKKITVIFFAAWVFVCGALAYAGVPINNLEGVGGLGFNPLAYLAQSKPVESDKGINKYLKAAMPRFGAWYVSFPGAAGINWTSFSVADSVHNRVEFSYGYEYIRFRGGDDRNKHNVGTKLLLIPEGWNKDFKYSAFVPAVSVGMIYKNTTNVHYDGNAHPNGIDGYWVASKLISQLPIKTLLSGGGLLTQGRATGVFGYEDRSAVTMFGNIDILPLDYLCLGYEIKQGANFGHFKNANYMNAHIGWMPNQHVSLVVAYIYAGPAGHSTVGMGNGIATNLNIAF